MIDEKIVRLRAHRKNVERYLRLLQTTLTDVERQYIEARLTEERSAMARLSNVTDQARNREPSANPARGTSSDQPEVPATAH